jgi:outer membrane protein OmpA-like peptidoglycan-associated protein
VCARVAVLLALALALGACAGERSESGAPAFVTVVSARAEAQLVEELGDFQSPGPNASDGLRDERGGRVDLSDDVVFASSVVSYAPGMPAPIPEATSAQTALGPPDYVVDVRSMPRAVSLGNGGTIVLRFDGAGLGDAPGPDLFVFEIGALEAVEIALSDDAETWRDAGRAPGGASAIDLAPWVHEGEAFHFVRLHDVPRQGVASPGFPGADIDAVGVRAGATHRLALPSQVLFDFDEDQLSGSAPGALDQVLSAIGERPNARVTIEGHTDDVGTADYNQRLSERRAEAVAAYLSKRGVARERLTVRGFGASRPVAPNDGEDHRRENRRVEIVIDGH